MTAAIWSEDSWMDAHGPVEPQSFSQKLKALFVAFLRKTAGCNEPVRIAQGQIATVATVRNSCACVPVARAQTDAVRFATFKAVWKELEFTMVLRPHEDKAVPPELIAELFESVLAYLFVDVPIAVHVGVLYTVYDVLRGSLMPGHHIRALCKGWLRYMLYRLQQPAGVAKIAMTDRTWNVSSHEQREHHRCSAQHIVMRWLLAGAGAAWGTCRTGPPSLPLAGHCRRRTCDAMR